ncbi:23810_t:CDS:2 [Cetraspora pellucida]|uniref:23810_t:CDS:1 n=1 Tax=Cetraspora pellucida TaxID=1433469 RepID=A0A9N9FXI5_9GLOM|nr:23810_t:CDS:2 [Cetraspora pellucida]
MDMLSTKEYKGRVTKNKCEIFEWYIKLTEIGDTDEMNNAVKRRKHKICVYYHEFTKNGFKVLEDKAHSVEGLEITCELWPAEIDVNQWKYRKSSKSNVVKIENQNLSWKVEIKPWNKKRN